MTRTLERLFLATVASTVMLIHHPGFAQQQEAWPAKPVRLVVGFAPGGGADTAARLIGNKLGAALGQPLLVENKPGAGSTLGAAAVARAAPDGYTLLLGSNSGITIAPHVYKKLPYRPQRELVPVALFGQVPQVLVVSPSVPANDLKGLIELLKKSKGSFNYGSFGTGSSSHLGMEMFKQAAGVEMTHVPYKGSALMLNDLLSGQITIAIDLIQTARPHMEASKLRSLAISSAQRSPLTPDLPTFTELGYPGLTFSGWYGIFVPTGTPDAIVKRLADEIAKAVDSADVRAQFAQLGIEAMRLDGPQVLAFLEKDSALWGAAARISGAQID